MVVMLRLLPEIALELGPGLRPQGHLLAHACHAMIGLQYTPPMALPQLKHKYCLHVHRAANTAHNCPQLLE